MYPGLETFKRDQVISDFREDFEEYADLMEEEEDEEVGEGEHLAQAGRTGKFE
jgi:hypothetical protein